MIKISLSTNELLELYDLCHNHRSLKEKLQNVITRIIDHATSEVIPTGTLDKEKLNTWLQKQSDLIKEISKIEIEKDKTNNTELMSDKYEPHPNEESAVDFLTRELNSDIPERVYPKKDCPKPIIPNRQRQNFKANRK